MSETIQHDDDQRCAEYVIGTLPQQERTRLEHQLQGNLALQSSLAWWAEKMHPMTDSIAPITPPASVLKAINRRLFAEAPVAPWWQRVGLWQGVSAACLALMLAMGSQLIQPSSTPDTQPDYLVAQLASDAHDLQLSALYNPAVGTLRLTRHKGSSATGRDLELWLIAGGAPVSLGVLPPDPRAEIAVPAELQPLMAANITLAISDEPLGGSPTGQPTGDVLAAGAVAHI